MEIKNNKKEPKGNIQGLLRGTAGMFRLAAIAVMTVLCLAWLFLLVLATEHGTSVEYNTDVVADTVAIDSIGDSDIPLSDTVSDDDATDNSANASQGDKSNMELLTTFVCRASVSKWTSQYYWDAENHTLNVCTDNGEINHTFNLGDDYGIYYMKGENGVVTTEYNNNVYFVGYRGGNGSGWMTDCMVFYLSPMDGGEELHVLVKECAEASFSGSTVRANFPEILNESTASCEADYEYADHWRTIKLE